MSFLNSWPESWDNLCGKPHSFNRETLEKIFFCIAGKGFDFQLKTWISQSKYICKVVLAML